LRPSYILVPGEVTWVLTEPVYIQIEEGVCNHSRRVAEVVANAYRIAVLPFESSQVAILA